ncbi:MAG: hypothetical protein KatS3mg068_1783 [Candidatus Sericytochromatia bacterium]|nr:MAG: hypothetical protein KatS3mg068_1783 [Candidatus Sericytochromatia bacterium]
MERKKQENNINPVNKLHVIYGSIIIFLCLSFSISIFTLKNSYEKILEENNISFNKNETKENANTSGMPPFVKKMFDEYKTALEKNPNDIKALVGLGNMYYDSGQYQKAIEYYEKAIKINPNDSNVLTDLGTCYFNTEQNQKAIKYYEKAIKNDPNHLNARFNIGFVYKTINKKDLAKKYWEEMYKMLKDDEQKKKLKSMIDELDKSS